MAHDTAYEGLDQAGGDGRWAYGTGFEDPLDGVDTAVPAGVEPEALAAYCLMLGDDALVLSHRLQQWLTRLPELEEEVAVANIALDLLGQARLLLSRAGTAEGAGRDEDDLAMGRGASEMRNAVLVEGVDADFAHLVVRVLLYSAWRLALFERLTGSADPILAAVAAKGAKELAYHRDFAAQWVIRLGDGTEESHRRAQAALDALWPLVDELFAPVPAVERLAGVAVDPRELRPGVASVVAEVLAAATLQVPGAGGAVAVGGRDGRHGPEMAELLGELQQVARALPGATW